MCRLGNPLMAWLCKGSLAVAATVFGSPSAHAQQFISVQDGMAMVIDGAKTTVDGDDSLAVIELSDGKAKVKYEIAVPRSVTGPPVSVDVSPGGTIALVTSGFKRDPSDPKKTVPDDR